MREDLIERLQLKRDVWRGTEFGDDFCELLDEAADTLEALRAERDLFRDETIELVRQNGEWQTRAERLAEALALLPDEIDMVEHNPDEGPLMFCCGRACGCRGVHGLLITHDEECWYVRMRALRDHDQEDRND